MRPWRGCGEHFGFGALFSFRGLMTAPPTHEISIYSSGTSSAEDLSDFLIHDEQSSCSVLSAISWIWRSESPNDRRLGDVLELRILVVSPATKWARGLTQIRGLRAVRPSRACPLTGPSLSDATLHSVFRNGFGRNRRAWAAPWEAKRCAIRLPYTPD